MDYVRVEMYCAEDYEYEGKILYKSIIERVCDENIEGVTAYRAIAGVGGKKRVRHSTLADLFEGLPIVVEIVDEREKVMAFLENNREELKGIKVFLSDVTRWEA